MNRNTRRTLGPFGVLVILSFGLASLGPAAAQENPPPPPESEAVEVRLGDNGGTVTLMTTAEGGFTLDGEAFVGGAENPVEGEGGRRYVLTLADGAWTAAFLPTEVMIDLGASGTTVTLATTEAGGWIRDGEAFSSGTTVQGGTNAATGMANEYELTLAEGTWTPTYRPVRMTIAGTGVEAIAREDGSGYDAGEDSLSASGAGEITAPGGAMYRVVKDADGMLAGTRFDRPIVGQPMAVNIQGTDNPAPKLSGDDRATAADEEGTALEALGAKFPIADLLNSGAATATGANIVAKARAEIAKIRDYVAALVALYRDDGLDRSALDGQIDDKWDDADDQLVTIFGSGTANRVGNSITLERETSPSRVVDAFDRLVEALSSEEAFAAATLAGGRDAMQGFLERTAAQASTAFNRPKSTAAVRFGDLGSTRFGAATFNETDKAQSGFGAAERVQAFAWATIEATRRASDVQTAGIGAYTGETLAADQAGNLYSGAIDIEVRFAGMSVDGLVTRLARADTQEPWIHGLGGEVTRIFLPTARLRRAGSWTVTDRSAANRGRLSFREQAGGWPNQPLDAGSSFSGRLLGRGDAAGTEVIGTWQAVAGSTTLAGGFGATRGLDRDPPGADLVGDLAAIGRRGDVWSRLETGPAALAAVEDDMDTMHRDESRAVIPASTVINTGNTKFKYDPPRTDEAVPTEYVGGTYEPQRAAVLEAGEFESERGNWVQEVREEIAKKLAQLRRSITLDGADASATDRTFANQQRQRLFNEIQAEMQKVLGDGRRRAGLTVFSFYTGVLTRYTGTLTATDRWTADGSSFHEDYPVNSAGVAQDAGVLAEIEDLLAALADADTFAAAFETDGLFKDLNTEPTAGGVPYTSPYPSPAEIFERPRGKLSMVAEATDFTRFGAWSHEVSENGAQALSAQTYTRGARGQELGAFAYSPLEPTAAYTSVTSRQYPARGAAVYVSATYTGETVAAHDDLFYKGAFEAKVFWAPAAVTDSRVQVSITDLIDTDSGEAVRLGGLYEVGSLTWTASVANDDGVVKFSSSADVLVSAAGLTEGELAPTYNRNLAFEHVSNYQQADDYNFGPANNNYRRLKGTQHEDFGPLSFTDVRVGSNTYSPNDAQRAQLTEDQNNLQMPVWAFRGPRVNTTRSSNNDKPTFVFVFRDGSMLQYADQHGTTWLTGYNAVLNPRWRPAIGVDSNKNPDNIYATHVAGMPALSANNGEFLFTRPGGPFAAGYPTVGASNAGLGAPAMSPSELFLSFVSAGGYDFETSAELEGMFVGQDADGPLGVIGTWSMGPIRGAFGADFEP